MSASDNDHDRLVGDDNRAPSSSISVPMLCRKLMKTGGSMNRPMIAGNMKGRNEQLQDVNSTDWVQLVGNSTLDTGSETIPFSADGKVVAYGVPSYSTSSMHLVGVTRFYNWVSSN